MTMASRPAIDSEARAAEHPESPPVARARWSREDGIRRTDAGGSSWLAMALAWGGWWWLEQAGLRGRASRARPPSRRPRHCPPRTTPRPSRPPPETDPPGPDGSGQAEFADATQPPTLPRRRRRHPGPIRDKARPDSRAFRASTIRLELAVDVGRRRIRTWRPTSAGASGPSRRAGSPTPSGISSRGRGGRAPAPVEARKKLAEVYWLEGRFDEVRELAEEICARGRARGRRITRPGRCSSSTWRWGSTRCRSTGCSGARPRRRAGPAGRPRLAGPRLPGPAPGPVDRGAVVARRLPAAAARRSGGLAQPGSNGRWPPTESARRARRSPHLPADEVCARANPRPAGLVRRPTGRCRSRAAGPRAGRRDRSRRRRRPRTARRAGRRGRPGRGRRRLRRRKAELDEAFHRYRTPVPRGRRAGQARRSWPGSPSTWAAGSRPVGFWTLVREQAPADRRRPRRGLARSSRAEPVRPRSGPHPRRRAGRAISRPTDGDRAAAPDAGDARAARPASSATTRRPPGSASPSTTGATAHGSSPRRSSGGVGLLDYDGDGRLDVYLVQGGTFPPEPSRRSPSGDRLFRNRGNGTFEDVTRALGLSAFPGGTATASPWATTTTTAAPICS